MYLSSNMYAVLIAQIPIRNTATVSENPRMKTFSIYRWVSEWFVMFKIAVL